MTEDKLLAILRECHKSMLINKKKAAKELGISEAGIDRLRQNGQLSSKKVLGQVMFSIEELSRYLADA